jgi:hypothetical protein
LVLLHAPPKTPLSVIADSKGETRKDIGGIVLEETPPALGAISTVTIGYEELPYTQPVLITTPCYICSWMIYFSS